MISIVQKFEQLFQISTWTITSDIFLKPTSNLLQNISILINVIKFNSKSDNLGGRVLALSPPKYPLSFHTDTTSTGGHFDFKTFSIIEYRNTASMYV